MRSRISYVQPSLQNPFPHTHHQSAGYLLLPQCYPMTLELHSPSPSDFGCEKTRSLTRTASKESQQWLLTHRCFSTLHQPSHLLLLHSNTWSSTFVFVVELLIYRYRGFFWVSFFFSFFFFLFSFFSFFFFWC